MIDRNREDEDVAASKRKALEDQSRGYTQKEEVVVSKKMWTTLFPPSFDRRQELRRRSEPIFPAKPSSVSEARPLEEDLRSRPQLESEGTTSLLFRRLLRNRSSGEGTSSTNGVVELWRRNEPIFPAKPSSVNEAHPMEEDFGSGPQLEREGTASPLFRRLLRNRSSGEGNSLTNGVVALRNHHFEENKEGSKGRVGSDLCGFTVTGSPSSPKIGGKGPIFEGYVCLLLLSHPSLFLPLLVAWYFLCRVPLVQISLVQSLFPSFLWKIELFLKFCSIKTMLAHFFKKMLVFLAVMRW
ncbi:hypothetical protein PVL29_014507 [Vitis rotundifolia]|uniref:Uncharacterized protein n=1 Tax=Vitis rotundifolia TaxID=103349 RepID=A0AA38ZH08_VITRO|nr:hypothetical protein PVL29_014507 [Vitis rotundifolia]